MHTIYNFDWGYNVDLESKTCNCRRFQPDEILYPCAITVLKRKNINGMSSYCVDYYNLGTSMKSYEVSVILMSDIKN